MASITTRHNAIRSHFNTQWTTLNPGIHSVAWENVDYNPPTPNPLSATATSYILVSLNPDDFGAIWASPGFEDNLGAIMVSVFSPLDAGPGVGEAIAEKVAQCFRGKTFDSGQGWFDRPAIDQAVRDGEWWRVNVRTPYFHQSTA